MVSAASCIGHGACFAACPIDAINLVFGTETRGVDIPNLTPDFESNVPGEEPPKVPYRPIDPVQCDGQAVLVVGGGAQLPAPSPQRIGIEFDTKHGTA